MSNASLSSRQQTELQPREVFCVTRHAYQDRKVAEAVCAGRFTHIGITLDLGTRPDWLSVQLPEDKEWRIEWSKFYYGMDLAHAFIATGDRKYQRAWEDLVSSWIEQMSVTTDRSDVIGRRVQNWIYAWNLFTTAPAYTGLSSGLATVIADSITAQVRYLRTCLTPERNHRTLELYALFIVAIAFPDRDPDKELLQFAIIELHRNLCTDVLADGVHRESSTHYHMVALRTYLAARENASRYGVVFPDGYDAHLEHACEFAMHCHRPDGSIPALSDSDSGSYLDLLILAGRLLHRPDFTYVASAGRLGSPPSDRYVSFPIGGYFVQRSGWGETATAFADERFLIFDCGPLGDGGHGHYDMLNLEIAANGQALVVDPGRYTYTDHDGEWRHWFKGTQAHNTVTVDHCDQISYQRSKPKGELARAVLLLRSSAPGLDILIGQVHSPVYEAVHSRCVAFVGDEYWIIMDTIVGQIPHRYDLRYHLSADAQHKAEIIQNEYNSGVRAPGMTLLFAPIREPRLDAGWVSKAYGEKQPAPVVTVTAAGEATAAFYTLVMPQIEHSDVATLSVERASGLGATLRVTGLGRNGEYSDQIQWNTAPNAFHFDSFVGEATAVWLRTNADGYAQRFVASNAVSITATEISESVYRQSGSVKRWFAWDRASGFHTGVPLI